MKSTVLITGVAGFLGSHLAMHHIRQGDEVWGLDNFCSSRKDSAHMKELMANPSFTFRHIDICDVSKWHTTAKFDVVYNFACPASPPVYQRMPVETTMTCTLGTKNILDLASRHGSVVVHASTSEVYGDPLSSPQREIDKGNVNSYGPRACYDEGKRAAEALCFDYLHTRNVDVRLVRIFNTYGPHMDPNDGRVVSNFICQALSNEPLVIYGQGKQTRSFCYVDDLVRGIVALGALSQNPLTPVNLGNPNEFTVLELANIVHEKVSYARGLAGGVNHRPLPIDDPQQRRPDITLARDLLRWEPKVELKEGLEKTIEYFRSVIP